MIWQPRAVFVLTAYYGTRRRPIYVLVLLKMEARQVNVLERSCCTAPVNDLAHSMVLTPRQARKLICNANGA